MTKPVAVVTQNIFVASLFAADENLFDIGVPALEFIGKLQKLQIRLFVFFNTKFLVGEIFRCVGAKNLSLLGSWEKPYFLLGSARVQK